MTATTDPCLADRTDPGIEPGLDDRNGPLAEAVLEDRDPDPLIAERQADIDRCAGRGDWGGAESALARVREMQDRRDRSADRERE